MSLKGKIEAIIYAAEDPVTLDQIAVLLKKDVLDDIAAAKKTAEEAAAAQEASAAPQDTVTASHEAWGETTDSAAVPPAEAIEPTATASEEPSEARQHPERAPDAPVQEASDEQTPPGTDDATVPPPVATEATATASEQPSEAGQHPERAPDSAASEPNSKAAPQTSTAPEAAQEAQASEPGNAEAQVTAPAAVAPKKKKATDPDLPRVKAHLRTVLQEMVATYESEDRGIEIRQIAGGYRMATKPEHHDVVRAFAKSLKPPIKLSLQALETLAIVAYKQPVTAPEISEIRGVDSGGVVATLLDRKLITTAGRKQVIGRPIQYKTTKEFLLRFGLNDLGELPSMEEFEKLAQETTDLFSADVPAETGSAASETVSGEPADEESMLEAAENTPERAPEDSPERSEDRSGDYSSGADTAESVVRDQVEGEQQVQPEMEGVSIPDEALPDTAPQRPPQEPAERPDEGDYSSGADTSESIIREQVEDETPATSEPVDAEKPSSESLGS